MKRVFVFIAALTLHGCGIGGMWMNGNPFYGREPYIPFRDYWVKEEPVNFLQRSNDWIECGGDHRGGGNTRWSKFPGSDRASIDARNDYFNEMQRCMLRKGYFYVGVCRESNADYPACGAP